MREPKDHYQQRGWIESLLRKIPGFRGYLEKEYRRDSDRLQREWLADRLQAAKTALDGSARTLAESAQLDALPACDRVRGKLDKLIASIRGAMRGYSAFFDLVQVDEAVLDRVYQHDVAVTEAVEDLAETVEKLDARSANFAQGLEDLLAQVDRVDQRWQLRSEILSGME